jgi:hypothetical protein
MVSIKEKFNIDVLPEMPRFLSIGHIVVAVQVSVMPVHIEFQQRLKAE